MSNGSAPKPGGSQNVTLDGAPQTASAPVASAAAPKKTDGAIKVATPPPVVAEDPFKAPKASAADRVSIPLSKPIPAVQPSPTDSNNQAFNPMKGDILPSPDGHVEIKPEAPTFKVMGVVTGDKASVVLRYGTHDLVLALGDFFGDNYRVTSITTTQVVIQMGKTVKVLPVMAF